MSNKPNIVLIILDTIRTDQFTSYGNPRMTTPNIDELVDEGVRYEHAYAASPWTLPSHASIFTGLYPSIHRADWDTRWMSSEHTTIAQYLKSFHYQSAAVVCNNYIAYTTNISRGFDVVKQIEALWGTALKPHNKNKFPFLRRVMRALHRRWRKVTTNDRGTKQAVDQTIQWLNTVDKTRPVFLTLNFMESHLPYITKFPERFRFVAPEQVEKAKNIPMDFWHHVAGTRVVTDEEMELLRLMSDGGLYYMDHHVGRLFDHLKQLEMYDNSLIIVTSDHGESFGEEGLLGHQFSVGEQLINIPLVIRYPDAQRAGEVDNRLVQLTDIFPTIIDLVASEHDWKPNLNGKSLISNEEHDHIFVEYLKPVTGGFERMYPDLDLTHWKLPYRAMIELPYKLRWRGDGQIKLYNIVDDPHEQADLVDTMPEKAKEMLEMMLSRLGSVPELGDDEVTKDLEEIAPQLRALGYM